MPSIIANSPLRVHLLNLASYEKGEKFEEDTEEKLAKFGFNAVLVPRNFLYSETFEQYGRPTQVDVSIDDNNDNEVAIIECKSYTSKWNNDEAVDQAKRLVHVANERGIPLIFSTPDGTTDCFGSRVKEVLNETQCFVISPDNIFFADPSDVKENGVTQGLPPELQSHRNTVDSGSGDSGGSWDLFGNWFGDSSDSKSSNSSDSNTSDSSDSGGSWDLFGNWFGDSSDSQQSDSSDSNSTDSDDSGGSWFSGWFGDSSDSQQSDSSDSNSTDSGSSYSSDSDSSYSSDSDSSYSSDSDSSYSSDSGSSDYGSGDSGDSGGSDSSSSSSDSWW